MDKKTILKIAGGGIVVFIVIILLVVLSPVFSEYKTVSDEIKKDQMAREIEIEESKNNFKKNDEPVDSNNYRTEADGTFVNTSGSIFAMHTSDYIQVSDMRIRTLKDNPKKAVIEARVTNNSDLVISNVGVHLTFSFSDGSTSKSIALPVNYIPVGGSTVATVEVLNRVIDASDYSFVVQSFNGGGAG